MLNRLKELNQKVLNLITKYENKIIGILIAVLVLGGVTLYSVYKSNISTPMSVREFANTSVKITNMGMTSGGSGSVYESSDQGSLILTNDHVCKLVKSGGIVTHNGFHYLVMSYKSYRYHDLCLIRVSENLGVSTKIATFKPQIYDRALISGHPALLPHVLTEGNFSGSEIIQVLIGVKPCTARDNSPLCFFLGGLPIIKSYEAQLVTGTILPGSSGSAVFNSDGEVSGVVFAGRSRELSYAYIVPYIYVKNFIETRNLYKDNNVDYKSVFGKEEQEETIKSICRGNKTVDLPFCKNAIETLIWEL
jgi:S1-C subfamily serine protease